MRKSIGGREEELGFHLYRKRSRRVAPIIVTDLDFADDFALLTVEIEQAQEILRSLEHETAQVGLHCNAKKTELQLQAYYQEQPVNINARDGTPIKVVPNFKYLGAWTESTDKDFAVRKALAWSACQKLRKIWSSLLPRKLNVRLFVATVESVLLYGSEAWTITKTLQKQLDGCYTRILRMAVNVSWRNHLSNEQLYQELPKVSCKVQKSRMRLAGHCVRHSDEAASEFVLWQPVEGRTNRGRRRITYVDNLLQDTGMENTRELRTCMIDRTSWRERVEAVGRPDGRPR